MQREQVEVGASETAKSTYARGFFDLITFTNASHDVPDPVGTLAGLRRLLAQEGQLVVEDFARREHPFAWAVIEWLAQQIEGTYVRAYTLAEAHSLCQQAGLHVACGRSFTVDWLWHGWVLGTYRPSSEAGPARI